MSLPEWCERCKGTGRMVGCTPQGLVCQDCDGTGDYFRACVRRAYNRGLSDGLEALKASTPKFPPTPKWDDLVRPEMGL